MVTRVKKKQQPCINHYINELLSGSIKLDLIRCGDNLAYSKDKRYFQFRYILNFKHILANMFKFQCFTPFPLYMKCTECEQIAEGKMQL